LLELERFSKQARHVELHEDSSLPFKLPLARFIALDASAGGHFARLERGCGAVG
jgi:hypothetical protein